MWNKQLHIWEQKRESGHFRREAFRRRQTVKKALNVLIMKLLLKFVLITQVHTVRKINISHNQNG